MLAYSVIFVNVLSMIAPDTAKYATCKNNLIIDA